MKRRSAKLERGSYSSARASTVMLFLLPHAAAAPVLLLIVGILFRDIFFVLFYASNERFLFTT